MRPSFAFKTTTTQKSTKDTDEGITTLDLDKKPDGNQYTEVEFWGVLQVSGSLDMMPLPSADRGSDQGEDSKPKQPVIHEGELIGDRVLMKQCIVSVAVGGGHVALLSRQGIAWMYGRNDHGQLGVGDDKERQEPEQVQRFKTTFVEQLRTGQAAARRTGSSTFRRTQTTSSSKAAASDPSDNVGLRITGGGSTSSSAAPPSSDSQDIKAKDMFVVAVACGLYHTIFLTRAESSGAEAQTSEQRVFTCGIWDSLGLDGMSDREPQNIPQCVPNLEGVTAIAAREKASCGSIPWSKAGKTIIDLDDDAPSRQRFSASDHLVYLWGDTRCCLRADSLALPTPVYRIPATVKALALGGFVGLALTTQGEVYAWGDSTYGELGGADGESGESDLSGLDCDISVPGRVWKVGSEDHTEPLRNTEDAADTRSPNVGPSRTGSSTGKTTTQGTQGNDQSPIAEIACGERHCLLLNTEGRLFAFGDNLAGQCGVPEAIGAGHLAGSVVPRPVWCRVEGPQRGKSKDDARVQMAEQLGAHIFAGRRHSALVTRENRLYVWGHPSNRKLGHAGFNPDGTVAGEDPHIARPPGVAVRSPLRDAVRRPRPVYSLLHRSVQTLGLGDECTFIVSGNGGGEKIEERDKEKPSATSSVKSDLRTAEDSSGIMLASQIGMAETERVDVIVDSGSAVGYSSDARCTL